MSYAFLPNLLTHHSLFFSVVRSWNYIKYKKDMEAKKKGYQKPLTFSSQKSALTKKLVYNLYVNTTNPFSNSLRKAIFYLCLIFNLDSIVRSYK